MDREQHTNDGRKSRNEVNLSKREYIKKYDTLQSDLVEMHEKRNIRGKLIISSGTRVATCTVINQSINQSINQLITCILMIAVTLHNLLPSNKV